MFLGTITTEVKKFMGEEFKRHLKDGELYEPFGGIFTLSQTASRAKPNVVIHSSDVSAFSRAIGLYLGGQYGGVEVKQEVIKEFYGDAHAKDPLDNNHAKCSINTSILNGGLLACSNGMPTPLGIAVAALYFAEYAPIVKRLGTSPYFERMRHGLYSNRNQHFSEIARKLLKAKDIITPKYTFYEICGLSLCRQSKSGDTIFFDPPFFLKGYDKMFEGLDNYLTSEHVPFTEITPQIRDEKLQEYHEKGCKVYHLTNEDRIIPNYEKRLRAQYKPGASYYIYSNKFSKNFLVRHEGMPEAQPKFPVLYKDDVLTKNTKAEIVPVERKIMNHYRLLWTKKADMKDVGGKCYLVLLDGKVAGVINICSGQIYNAPYAALISDVASPYSRYKRLSRLILWLLLSTEFLNRVNHDVVWDHEGFSTAVYTDKPKSMKYRGLFEKISTEENEGEFCFKHLYRSTTMKSKTIQKSYKGWFNRYGKDTKV